MTRQHPPPSLADRLVGLFVERAAGSLSLARLSGRLGVRAVVSASDLGGCAGLTSWESDGPLIALAAGLPPVLRRWTWAHELAHVMVARHDTYWPEVRARLDTGGVIEERLCDAIARSLLIPWRCFEQHDSHLGVVEQMLRVAAQCDVPAWAVAHRVAERQPVSMVSLRRLPDASWSADRLHGVDFCAFTIDATQNPRLPSMRLDPGTFANVRTEVKACIDGKLRRVALRVHSGGGEVWAQLERIDAQTPAWTGRSDASTVRGANPSDGHLPAVGPRC